MGRPRAAASARASPESGTRMPTCFCFDIITSGTSRVASRTKVKAPGVRLFIVRYAKLLTCAYFATSDRSGHRKDRGFFRSRSLELVQLLDPLLRAQVAPQAVVGVRRVGDHPAVGQQLDGALHVPRLRVIRVDLEDGC